MAACCNLIDADVGVDCRLCWSSNVHRRKRYARTGSASWRICRARSAFFSRLAPIGANESARPYKRGSAKLQGTLGIAISVEAKTRPAGSWAWSRLARYYGFLDGADAARHDWMLMVDDAHGLGCLGDAGRGCMSLAGLNAQTMPILVGTFGKAFGTAGAFVATSHDFADYLTQFARPYVYTTAMSPAMAGATLASLQIIQSDEGEERRARLAEHVAYFRQRVKSLPVALMPSNTAIQPIVIGDSKSAIRLSEQLKALGIWCTAIRPPTVPAGSARLRITLSAAHSDADLVLLCDSLEKVLTAKLSNATR